MALQYPPGHPNFGQSAQPSRAELAAYAVEYPPVPDRTQIWKALMGLDDIWICTLLLRISDTQARVAWEIWDECKRRRREPQLLREMTQRKKARLNSQQPGQRTGESVFQLRRQSLHSDASTATAAHVPLTFDEEARAVWFMLKREYAGKKEVTQIEAAPVVYKDIVWVMNSIREQTAPVTVSFESRRNALETLRNIGESILNAPETLGDEVRKRFRGGAGLKEAMVSVLRHMRPEEREKIANLNDCQSTFHERVAALASRGAVHEVFDEMKSVADFLKGEITIRELDKMRSTSSPDDVEIKEDTEPIARFLISAPGRSPNERATQGVKRKRPDISHGSEISKAMMIDVQSANRSRLAFQSARQDSALDLSTQLPAIISTLPSSGGRSLSGSSNGHSNRASTAGRSSLHLAEIVDSDSSPPSSLHETFEHSLRRDSSGMDQPDQLFRRYPVPERLDLT